MTITAADVKSLRERTGLPMMDCKKALEEAGGDQDKAVDMLRERGDQVLSKRADRETAFGRMGIYTSDQVGAMVELKCESAPVTKNEEFITLANDLAQQLATGPGAKTADELLDQPSPSKSGQTLREQRDDLFNRIREVFNVGRMVRIDGPCGGYSHNAATVAGVLLEVEGGTPEEAKNICMHIAAMRPQATTVADLDPAVVQKEREILTAAAKNEGKPESIVEKMVEGRLKSFYAESVLVEQQFVVGEGKETVGAFAKDKGMKIKQFAHWILGEDAA